MIKPAGTTNPPTTGAADATTSAKETNPQTSVPNTPEKYAEPADSNKMQESIKQFANERAGFANLGSKLMFQELNRTLNNTAPQGTTHTQYIGNQGATTATKAPIPKHADQLFKDVDKSNGYDQQLVPPNNEQYKKDLDTAASEVKKTMQEAKLLISQGKYETAKQHLEATLSKKFGSLDGEHALRSMKGLGQEAIDTTRSLISQLDFTAKMQKAGIQTSMPPTEKQLKDYFATFKTNPGPQTTAEAKKAFTEYIEAFHVHPAKSSGDSKADVVYSSDKTKTDGKDFKTANSWKEVTTDRDTVKTGQYAGRSVNDCEGYAYLSETLLGAAGFKVKGYVTGQQQDGPAHIMVLLDDPQGKPVVTSNEGLYDASNVRMDPDPKQAVRDLLDAGWSGAGAVGAPNYYIGDSSAESQSHMVNKVKTYNL